MSDVGNKALGGVFEKIAAKCFVMEENMLMTFKGYSCNIIDDKGKVIAEYGPDNEEVKKDVGIGYKCYVMRALVKFEKKSLDSS